MPPSKHSFSSNQRHFAIAAYCYHMIPIGVLLKTFSDNCYIFFRGTVDLLHLLALALAWIWTPA